MNRQYLKSNYIDKIQKLAIFIFCFFAVVACGGGGGGGGSSGGSVNTYSISGTVESLTYGKLKLGLFENGKLIQSTTVYNLSGSFNFNGLSPQNNYAITVYKNPTNEVCTVNNGAIAGLNSNVTGVVVQCSVDSYTVGGTVQGLISGQTVTLINNNDIHAPLVLNANGNFTFSKPIAYWSSYQVTVGLQPNNETCTVNNNNDSLITANVTNIVVQCSTDSYSVSANIQGLDSDQIVTLINKGHIHDPITDYGENTSFTFNNKVAFNGSYNVTVSSQPSNEYCSVNNGYESNVSSNISVTVQCSADSYSIGGNIVGLQPGQTISLTLNGDKLHKINESNGNYTFPTNVAYYGNYDVQVTTEPSVGTCIVSNGQGTVEGNVTNVNVNCYTQSGDLIQIGSYMDGDSLYRPAVTQDGKYLYTAEYSESNNILMYFIGSNGQLASIGSVNNQGCSSYCYTAITTSGSSAYVVNSNNSDILVYSIGSNGQLTYTSRVSGPGGNSQAAIVATGLPYLYVVESGINKLSAYTIGGGGGLTLSSSIATGNAPVAIATNTMGDNTYIYVVNKTDNTISEYVMTIDGTLEDIGTTTNTGQDPSAITVAPGNGYVYVSSYLSDRISMYSINNDGQLQPLSPSTVSSSDFLSDIAATNAYVYAVGINGIYMYSIGIDGQLQLFSAPSSLNNPASYIVASPLGNYVYATCSSLICMGSAPRLMAFSILP